MTDLEEANALKSLVDYYGSQTKAAKRLGVPQATLSIKQSLLKLSPELHADLVAGTRKVEHVRNLGKLSPKEQQKKKDERAEAALEKNRDEDREREHAGPDTRAQAGAPAAKNHGVIIPGGEPASEGQAPFRRRTTSCPIRYRRVGNPSIATVFVLIPCRCDGAQDQEGHSYVRHLAKLINKFEAALDHRP